MAERMKFSNVLMLTAVGLLMGLSMSASRSNAQGTASHQLSPSLFSSILNDPQKAAAQYVQELYSVNQSGVLTQDMIDTGALIDRSGERARFLSRVLSFDLDANLDVSEEEVGRATSFVDSRQISWIQTQIKLGDADGNSSLSISEAAGLFDIVINQQGLRRRSFQRLMEFDENADGQVTVDEVLSIIRQVTVGGVVAAPAGPQSLKPRALEREATCGLPPPSEQAEVLYISGYEGKFVSSVATESQDRETSLAKLVIEPGAAPLYVVATAYDSIVWQFSGATERIERVIVADVRGVGVVGIDTEKVEITSWPVCLPKYAYKQNSRDLAKAKAAIAVQLKREITHSYTAYGMGEIVLPSGLENLQPNSNLNVSRRVFIRDGLRHIKTEDGFVPIEGPNADRKMVAEITVERMLRRMYPGGVVDLDADAVVSRRPVQSYEILPQQAGLLQLVRSGHLDLVGSRNFRIAKTFGRFPAGLNGGHSVEFLLAPGVELPKGSPGHSTVIAEDTGACLIGVRCR